LDGDPDVDDMLEAIRLQGSSDRQARHRLTFRLIAYRSPSKADQLFARCTPEQLDELAGIVLDMAGPQSLERAREVVTIVQQVYRRIGLPGLGLPDTSSGSPEPPTRVFKRPEGRPRERRSPATARGGGTRGDPPRQPGEVDELIAAAFEDVDPELVEEL